MKLIEINPKEVKVKEGRIRKDFGEEKEWAEFCESIKQKGLIQPITINPSRELIAGERRLRAALAIELEVIPAVIRDITDDLDEKEIELFENVHRKNMTWAEEASAIAEIEELYTKKFPLSKGVQGKVAEDMGKSRPLINKKLKTAEMLLIMPSLAECKTEEEATRKFNKAKREVLKNQLRAEQERELDEAGEEDLEEDYEAPNSPNAQAQVEHDKRIRGLLRRAKFEYQINDAFVGLQELIDLRKASGGESKLKLAEVDPPYGIDLKNMKKKANDDVDEALEAYHEVDAEEYPEFLKKLCPLIYDVLADDAFCIFWYGSSWHVDVKLALMMAGFEVDPIPAIWYKGAGQTMNPEVRLARTYEPFWIARKGNPSIAQRGRGNVFHYTGMHASKKHHPTEKPIELMTEILSTFLQPGEHFVCPFLGSGVTLRASYITQNRGLGFELNEGNLDPFLLKVQEDEERRQFARVNPTDPNFDPGF